jgi:hypothetical protein
MLRKYFNERKKKKKKKGYSDSEGFYAEEPFLTSKESVLPSKQSSNNPFFQKMVLRMKMVLGRTLCLTKNFSLSKRFRQKTILGRTISLCKEPF